MMQIVVIAHGAATFHGRFVLQEEEVRRAFVEGRLDSFLEEAAKRLKEDFTHTITQHYKETT